jgi:hypothetical protein
MRDTYEYGCGCPCNACAIGTHNRCYAGNWDGYDYCASSGKSGSSDTSGSSNTSGSSDTSSESDKSSE